jgi:hypothetical protein
MLVYVWVHECLYGLNLQKLNYIRYMNMYMKMNINLHMNV